MRFDDGIFGLYSQTYENRREVEYSLEDYLRACSDDAAFYAGPAERLLKAIGEPVMVDTAQDPRLGRIFMNRTIKIYPAFADDFFGMEDTIERIVGFFRHAAQGLEERKQVLYLLGPVGGGKSSLAERLKQLMEKEPVYALKAGNDISPVFESPLGLFDPLTFGEEIEKRYGVPKRRLTGTVGGQAPRGIRRRHHQIHRGADAAVAAEADLRRQDRTRRREQPGRRQPRWQGRYPQAGDVQPERSRRLFLLRRPQPHDAGVDGIRRDVQGADQDAASVTNGDAGRQLRRHREHRRHPVPGHHPRALERSGVAELQEQ